MSDPSWLILRLEAPLLAFGGVTIDHIGVTRDFPAQSMLAGLLANALGFERTDWDKIQSLQDRLVFAARRDRGDEMSPMTDVQNAWLEKNSGWTTRETLEGRSEANYPHRRRRDYHMDARVMVALRLEPAEQQPDFDALAAVLERPARPLFIGRKPCLPSAPMLLPGRVTAPDAYTALLAIAGEPNATPKKMRALWPQGEGPETGENVWRMIDLPDLRNWRTGLHGGTRRIVEGTVFAPEIAA
ncbi:type I-E CRISPR-associated protein Cas5/CasD [Rhodoblastus acidophilus]|uniref:Type I-E CRISPR-associated protein Cas5/CasD n=1 Tax=Rhodoblastus acidophilus TaxID=1074 RepID=A0A6N8DM76_RHOAC|nr:type I-E CRISPR-associated protein Cas5/CasD [Rhodoblastus acidophilus]MCW2274730.1 CRISPR system Cascade subunit CasD [Rhodoblastus acidophilus]MTV31682.1 type I-E CRISPR-associated protein Cas5/CasD [Rhodoblastus acidophilus]